jgi:hypothetical protein
MAGGIGASGAQFIIGKEMKLAQTEAKEMGAALKDVLNSLKDLKEELAGRVKVGKNDGDQANSTNTASAAQDKQPVGTGIFAPKEKGDEVNVMAAAMSGLSEAEKEDLKENLKLSEFEKKMALLSGLESALQDIKMDDPEDQQILEEFFKNMKDIKRHQSRLKYLDQQEQDLEAQLKQQDEQKGRSKGGQSGQKQGDQPVSSEEDSDENESEISKSAPSEMAGSGIKAEPLDTTTLQRRQAILGNLPKDPGGQNGPR